MEEMNVYTLFFIMTTKEAMIHQKARQIVTFSIIANFAHFRNRRGMYLLFISNMTHQNDNKTIHLAIYFYLFKDLRRHNPEPKPS